MNIEDFLKLCAAVSGILAGVATLNYLVMRLAIRSEILALECRLSEKYVTKETCKAIRQDCPALRALDRK